MFSAIAEAPLEMQRFVVKPSFSVLTVDVFAALRHGDSTRQLRFSGPLTEGLR